MNKDKKLHIWRRSPSFTIGCCIVLVFIIIALVPSWFTPKEPTTMNQAAMLSPPSAEYPFGTDNYGRCIYTRVIYGTRIDLVIGVGAMIIPLILGSVLGLVSGYYGGRIDTVLMRILDIFMAFPYMILAIAIVAIIGAGTKSLFISMWLVGWKEYTRLVRSEVLVVKNMEFVQAAKTLGYSDLRILFRHILPNVFSSSIVYGASDIVMCMLSGAAMSYLGLGVQAPTPEWGAIISGGKLYMSTAWWITIFPGLVMALAGLGFSLMGDGLSDLLRTKGR
ncbi:MAG: ABC transporter permease [Peptococcaceae bacterium]|nr:ABC transporter permease [Peptococcaceae bacterium]